MYNEIRFALTKLNEFLKINIYKFDVLL